LVDTHIKGWMTSVREYRHKERLPGVVLASDVIGPGPDRVVARQRAGDFGDADSAPRL
jgi:hypothetical protein